MRWKLSRIVIGILFIINFGYLYGDIIKEPVNENHFQIDNPQQINTEDNTQQGDKNDQNVIPPDKKDVPVETEQIIREDVISSHVETGDQATSNKPIENEIQSSRTVSVVDEILSLENSASFILVDSVQLSQSQGDNEAISKSHDTPPNQSESSASIIQASAESISLESAETATPILEQDLSSGIGISSITDNTESSPQPTVLGDAPSPTPVTAPPQSTSDSLPITDETEPGGKQEEDFPSFTEWTQKVLAEQEKTKQESQSSSGQANTATASQKKLRNNYASNSCGAKILATNPEAENVKHVLTSNKDEYMINPCSAKKWFLVELCEPVQVKMVEMASLELFSSQPKSFRVFISDRYPAKEWQSLGVYEAKDERVIQTFHTTNDQFVKYIKVEMIEHYGNEHFCPITLFRLYGLPIADDDENDNDEQNLQTETDLESGKLVENDEEESKDGARNLFMSAKDTVVNLVKKVLNVDDGTKKDLDQDNNITGLHVDLNKNLSADGTILPCVPVILSGSEDELPTVLVPTPTIKETVATGSETVDMPIVTKLDDDEQIPSSHIDNVMLDIHQCFNVTPTTSSHKLLCSYINTMLRSSATSVCLKDDNIVSSLSDEHTTQVDMVTTDKPFEQIVTSLKEGSMESNSDRIVETPESPSELFESMHTVVTEDDSAAVPLISTQTVPSIESSQPSDKTPSSIQTEDVATHSESPVVHDHTSLDLPVSQTSVQGETTPITLEPSSTDIGVPKVEELETKSKVLDITTTALEGLDIVEQTKMESKAVSDILEPTTSHLLPDAISPTIEVSKTETVMSSHKVEPATPIVKPVVGVGEKVLEVKDKELKKPKDLDLVKVPLGSIAKRETAIMRLTNRIKALELNVSLSSRFLEELSQRFKKQNEEIMKLMNKTIARLNNSTRESEIHDIRQQRQLDILESRIDNLTSIVDNLAKNMEALTNKISDRQMVWTSVEFVILMIVCVVCLIRGRPVTISPELKQLLETMPKQPNPTMLQRRNSVDMGAMSHNRPASTIRKNASETTLVDPCLVNSNNTTPHPETHLLKEGVRRKKKKKFKNVESKSTTSLHERSKHKDQSSPVEISSEAGILFGADAVNTLTGLGIQEVDPGPASSSSSTVSLPAQCCPHPIIESCKENENSIQQVESQKYYSSNKSSVGIRTSGKLKKHNRPLSNGTSDIIIETIKPVLTKQKDERKQSLPSKLDSLKDNRGHKSRVSWLF